MPGAFGQNYVYWNVIQYRLERDGFRVYNISFPRFTLSDLRASASLLEKKIEEVRTLEGGRDLALLAHSMGGLISRYHMKKRGPGATGIHALVCLGTPHHGTYSALPGLPLKGARQVLPGSPFLTELNNGHGSHDGPPMLNVWSRTDVIVIPQRSAHLPLAGVDNRAITLGGHWGLLVSPKAYQWATEWFMAPGHSLPREEAATPGAPGAAGPDVDGSDAIPEPPAPGPTGPVPAQEADPDPALVRRDPDRNTGSSGAVHGAPSRSRRRTDRNPDA